MLLKQKNVVTKVPESVHPAAIKNVLIEDKKIVFYKKHPKNVVINLAIISKNIRKTGVFLFTWSVLPYSNIISDG